MNPYSNLPETAFWKLAVANKNMFDVDSLWLPKFPLERCHKIATYGSCFAQHMGKVLAKQGYSWMNTEPAPFGLSPQNYPKFNYNTFTCRTGNIYTTSLLRQWVEWALKVKVPPDEYWCNDSRVFDPFRPNIEPNGFGSKDEMLFSRRRTIQSFLQSIKQSEIFIFTLGLTESWFNREYGYEYPMCPGTVAGEYDQTRHEFVNQKYSFIKKNLQDVISMLKSINTGLRFILTVSPVPLTATNSGKHVLVATTGSKSTLRTVADELAEEYDFIDYFPSYEIINSFPFRGVFFNSNQRSVSQFGVDFVMSTFFKCLHNTYGLLDDNRTDRAPKEQTGDNESTDEVVCEEMILETFGTSKENQHYKRLSGL